MSPDVRLSEIITAIEGVSLTCEDLANPLSS